MDIAYLLWLQSIRDVLPDFMTQVFLFISDLGVGIISIILPPVFYWCIDKAAGSFMLMCFSFCVPFNQLIKNIACAYRPWIRDIRILPAPDAVPGATGYSFPSGHTSSATSTYGSMAYYYRKNRLPAIALCILFLLIGFSRNFLGVHTPQDVIVGLLIACLGILCVQKITQLLEKHPERDIWVLIIGIFLTFFFLLFITFKPYPMDYRDGILVVDPSVMSHDCFTSAGVISGFLLGWFIERRCLKFSIPTSIKTRLLRFVFGLIGAVIINSVIKNWFGVTFLEQWAKFLTSFTGYFYMTALYPFVFHLVEKSKIKTGNGDQQ